MHATDFDLYSGVLAVSQNIDCDEFSSVKNDIKVSLKLFQFVKP